MLHENSDSYRQVDYSVRSGVFPRINGLLLSDTAPLVVKFTVREHVDIGGTLKYHMMLYDSYLVSIMICVCSFFDIHVFAATYTCNRFKGFVSCARVYNYTYLV